MGKYADMARKPFYDEEGRTYAGEQNYKADSYVADYDMPHVTPNNPASPDYRGPDYQEPAWDPESGTPAPRAWDIHYKPSWFVEEQTNRKNPTYTPDENWSNEQVDAIANYVSGMKNAHPDEWKYGDPGWDTSTQLWQETIKPQEDAYASTQKQTQQVEQEQTQKQLLAYKPQETGSQYYSFHNNSVQTFDPNQEGVLSQDQIDAIKAGSPYKIHNVDTSAANYEDLSRTGKGYYNFMPGTAGTDVKNRKWYQRFSQPVLGAFMSASGPANIAKILVTALGGPVGWVYGATWAATAGYSYAKGANLIKGNKNIDKIIEAVDILDKKGAQLQGALAYGFEKAGGGDWTDWSKSAENRDFLFKNFGTIMHYAFGSGKASSEYNSDVVGIVGGLVPNMGANVVGLEGQGVSRLMRNLTSQFFDNPEDKIWLKRNQTTRSNSGLSGVYDIPDELLGTNAITYWLNYGQYLYDHGVTNPEQLEFELNNAINEVYGDLSNTSEFIEHEMGDIGNIQENMQAREMYVLGKAIGSENLQTAAKDNIGSWAGDLTGNIPVLPDVARGIAKLFGNNEFMKTSGGIDEVISSWNMENLQSTDPSKLTAADKRISGINPDGSLKSLTPLQNPNEIKNPFLRGAEKFKQLSQTTPEWRATMAGDSIMNFISTGIEDAMSARPDDDPQTRIDRVTKFVDELQNPEMISADSPFSKPSKTILFNSIKEDLSQAVRTRRPEIDKVIQDYAKLEPNRQVLNTLSESLGLTPDKIMKMYQDEKTVLAQMIINKADQNGGKIPGIDIDVESREFGDRVISMLSPFAGKDAKAYDHRALMLQISSKISDGVTETLINKYHIEPEGWVYRFGDTIKKLQHLWLLGLSPSYLANNVVNNVLTRSALGYGGFMTPNSINDWTERFGFKPERFEESMAEGILGNNVHDKKSSSEKMREAIRAKRKGGNKFFDKVDSKLDWVSNHAGFFGNISGKIEELESRQIYTSAMMTYMARTWKPGVNFRKMDPQLENLIRSQNPAMVDAIYSAISSGVNMKEIEKAIYGTYVIPNVRDTMISAARNLGITDAEDAVIEIFDKGGVMTELMQALSGKRGDEVDAVIQKVGDRIKAYADLKLREDLARRADQIAKDANGYGFAEAIKLGQDLAENMGDLWLESQNANTQLFDRRLREGMGAKEFHALYQEHLKELNERWAGIYAEAQQTYSGILKGLGFIDQTANKYVDMMREKDGLWAKFYQERQPELFQPYLDALEWKTGESFEEWDSRVKQAWKDYKQASNTEYLRVIKAERQKQIDMDKVFADGLKAALGNINAKKVDEVIVPLQDQIVELRQQIIELNLEMRGITDATDVLNEKSQVYHDNDVRRAELKKQYMEAQQNLYKAIRDLGPQTEAPAVDSSTVEVDHNANIRNDITQREADAQKRTAEELANMDANDAAETEQMPDSEASNPNNWSEVLRKKTAYKIAKKLGATEEEAVAYSQLNKIHASEWEQNHPGMKFKDAGDMTVSYHQEAEQRIKGQFSIQDGKKLVELFKGSDISTLIHETMGHGWVTTLNDNQVEALAAYNGWTADRYRQLENQWYYDPSSMSEADRTAWVDSQEKFAYGFEQYLLEGTAPNSAMQQIFETFKRYLLEIYQGVRQLIYKGEPIDIHKEQHGVTLAEIFESMLIDSNREFNIDRTGLEDTQSNSFVQESYGYVIPENIRQFLMTDSAKRGEKITAMRTAAEESMRQETQAFLEENKKWGLTEPELQELVTEIMHGLGLNTDISEDMDLMESVQQKLNRFPGGEKAIKRFIDDHRETASKINDSAMDAMLTGNNPNWRMDDTYKYVLQQVESEDQVKKRGDFVMTTDEFKHGRYTCDRVVYHNGEIVAYLPKGMEATTIDAGNGKTAEVIGVSIQNPDQQMYVYDGEVFEEPKPQRQTENVFNGDAEDDSLGALDPEAQANHKITYEQALPILNEFGRVYKNSLNDAMSNKTFGSLDAKTKELVRQYIDNDVRTDLMNTKYKTGKFGEMMRDAALLNYSKRYGFDNALTLLFPYQFWQTRSAWNWLNRMGGKGGKMWRRYARLKELEERNKKEIMPSRITGKIGIYLPFLPDWMGDALFMPTSQLSIVGNFMDPLDDWVTDNQAVNATAERFVQEAYDNGDITPEEYQTAMDPAKRNSSAVWQEMFARAQANGDHDRDLGSLFKQYFGMSLPVSIGKALMTGNPDDWTQTPMTRTGTAFRALFGDNIIGKGLETAMSAPERALRAAAVKVTGNNDFRYQEFGNWGDYYIRNQLWDMVVEGRISAEQAMTAQAEKDGNKIWEQAADRQRQELLQKTQLLSATMPFKKMVEDVKNGNQDKLGDDFKYVLAELLTMWTPTSVVRDAERTWRADKAEMSQLYDTGTKEDRSQFYDEHPYYTYNNLRYEEDPEQALRSYLYKSITQKWYDLNDTEKDELKVALGTDFQRSILDKETRAYQTMDLDRLAAYAQAMNGSIPYLATDSLNTMNVPQINTNVFTPAQKSAQETYLAEREKQYPGMADVSNIYYKLPVEDRKIFRQANPNLDKYWAWNKQYKKDHPEVADFQKRRTDYYNTLNAENVFSMLDQFTIKELTRAAWSKDKVRSEYESAIERAMANSGITDKYDDFVKVLTDYILGE